MKVFNFENWVKISSKITNNCANSILWAKLLYFSFLSKLLEKSSRTVGEPLYVYDEIFLSWKRESNLSKISFFWGKRSYFVLVYDAFPTFEMWLKNESLAQGANDWLSELKIPIRRLLRNTRKVNS